MFQNQNGCSVLSITQAEEIQKSASTAFQKWSRNMVNVELWVFISLKGPQ